jgi:NADH:ubiquinone oxidoreductase subunit F (NADH-binding)
MSASDDMRMGSGVGNSGRKADYEFRAGAGAFAMGRDAALVQLHKGLHQGEAESEPARAFLPAAGALLEQVEHPRQ